MTCCFIIFVPYCVYFKHYIAQCLQSVLKQDYTHYRIVIVNDGDSTFDINEVIDNSARNNAITILTHPHRKGPAASKWTFLCHLQTQLILTHQMSHNDVVLILDGDDVLSTYSALRTLNEVYTNHKPWCTYGEASGMFCASAQKSAATIKYHTQPQTTTDYRKQWFYNHPRTFKAHLALRMTRSLFVDHQGEWLTKCTDRPIVYTMLECSGNARIRHVPNSIYQYREHPHNTYKMVSYKDKQRQMQLVQSLPVHPVVQEDIHIVMCCWKRITDLETQLNCLNSQNVADRIVIHLLNNNKNNVHTIENIVCDFQTLSKRAIRITLQHYDNTRFGFQRFLYVRDELLPHTPLDYVMFIDDDQLMHTRWVERVYAKRKPKHFVTWYGACWLSVDVQTSYWNDRNVRFCDCKHNRHKHIDRFHYGGTGGCVIDVNIFVANTELWNTSSVPHMVYNIEDLWLSFVITHYYDWTIQRSFEPITDLASNDALYKTLYAQKQALFQYLLQQRRWALLPYSRLASSSTTPFDANP